MRRTRKASLQTEEESLINLTPLIDVVFVVLILFILVAPMVHLDKIELAKGSGKEASFTPSEKALRIDVYPDNTIFVNRVKVPLNQLALHVRKTEEVPQLFCDKKAAFGTFQAVKVALEQAGFEELDIVLE